MIFQKAAQQSARVTSWRFYFPKDVAQTMPYRKVQFAKGSYYHIYNRGAGRHSIFYEDKNYLYLLDLLKRAVKRLNITVIVYCLLPNHYHWLVRQDGETPAGMLAKRVFGSYSQAFNHAYHRSGTLFEGPYRAILVESDNYLHHLCRYIHANPVRHGVAMAPNCGRTPTTWNGLVNEPGHWWIVNLLPRISRYRDNIRLMCGHI